MKLISLVAMSLQLCCCW